MDYVTMAPPEITALAVESVEAIAGDDVFVSVTAEAGEDSSDQPAYFFSFKLKTAQGKKLELTPGLLRLRLIQQLRDRLIAKGDVHYPIIKTLTYSYWEESPSA